MPDSLDTARAPHETRFLWVNLTREAHTALGESVCGAFDVRCVRGPTQIPAAIQVHAPPFLCFEYDEPDAPGMAALARTRREHPGLPVLMITGCHSEAVALWALRIRVWDLLVKPVSNRQLSECIGALIELTRRSGPGPAHETLFSLNGTGAPAALNGQGRSAKTYPAILHVATHFDRRIALDDVAALCRLSPSQFCRVFRQEQGLSFAQHLLHYRLERACEGLAEPGALAKEVAYSVGFNDLSYFTRAFKRQTGVCPSDYQAGARLS
ncbi:response regulator transcription factor [Polaromonas sp.]|uniref:helix-turn-helix transcriptional regulator n=1 Tax=Polaromonas sp. TaxID=1869339 RepID=UPI00286C1E51|nr:response regulator transcription factor [Polaromonas sp.]